MFFNLNKETDNFMNRVKHALTLPIRTRCAELTVLFDRGSTFELQSFFPLLIDNIFGPQGSISWGLRCSTFPEDDFRQLQHFLSPCGPLFKLIYTLLKEPALKYDFPVGYLPIKVQQMLDQAHAHPFYSDLVHVSQQTKHVISLLLNPFDYYMFHFAYYLINPWHQRTGIMSMGVTWNTVYYALCTDYMLHFLPTDSGAVILPYIQYHGKVPAQQFQRELSVRSAIGSTLINKNALNQSLEDYSLHQNYTRHPRTQIWRSETVLTVFTDMWLNINQISQPINQYSYTSNPAVGPQFLQYGELPGNEYMRIVRVLIKRLHSFSASAKLDDTHMAELKKVAIPMVQGKFYIMLRNLINRWPLDGSFRLVLELWLTYIQPWRYPSNHKSEEQCKANPDAEETNQTPANTPEREHLPFIAENLLAYVVIFQQLLPRFSRVDLVSPKMSIMLFRITKVFSQPNLATFLQEIERCVENNPSPTHSYDTHWATNLPPLNLTSNWCSNTNPNMQYPSNISWSHDPFFAADPSNFRPAKKHVTFSLDLVNTNNSSFINSLAGDKKWAAIVKQKIYELEGPSFYYKPLFTMPPAPEVFEIIGHIKRCIVVAQELVDIRKSECSAKHDSVWAFIKSIFEQPAISDEFSLSERTRVPSYLSLSLQNIKDLFHISEIDEQKVDPSSVSTPANSFEPYNDSTLLTPPRVRERISKVRYEGDPDLHPIRSSEIAFLVRMFYQLALMVNEKYHSTFCQLYYNPNYWGRLSRQILCAPITAYRFDKTKSGSPRVGTDLPPRMSFRTFATYSFVFYFIIGALLAKVLGYSLFTYLFILLSICMLYKCLKAVSSTPVRHNYPTQGFGNISFSDSF